MSHIFISYSRQDQAYVTLLAQALESHRLPLWLDDRIDYGTTWPRVIQDQLEQCAVFLLVMSPRSENSHWVQCELSMALELKKPLFPLLLEGRRWLAVAALQGVDVVGGKLPPVNFFEPLRFYFPTSVSTADSITLQDVVTDTLPSRGEIPTLKSSTPQTQTQADDLSSEKGIDYTRLRDLLKAQEWKEADQKTYEVMIRAVGKNSGDRFNSDELLNFPCTDFNIVDSLWVKYSNGHFGFSVQKQIYYECGTELGDENLRMTSWRNFGQKIGWLLNNSWIYYENVTFDNLLAPKGHLPTGLGGLIYGAWWSWQDSFPYLVARLERCSGGNSNGVAGQVFTHKKETIAAPNPAPTPSAMTIPQDRTELYLFLLNLPGSQFDAVLFDLKPPRGNISPATADVFSIVQKLPVFGTFHL